MEDFAAELKGRKSPSKWVIMEMLSAEYGWTPQEIKQLSPLEVRNYLKIIEIKRRIQKAEIDKTKHGRK